MKPIQSLASLDSAMAEAPPRSTRAERQPGIAAILRMGSLAEDGRRVQTRQERPAGSSSDAPGGRSPQRGPERRLARAFPSFPIESRRRGTSPAASFRRVHPPDRAVPFLLQAFPACRGGPICPAGQTSAALSGYGIADSLPGSAMTSQYHELFNA